MTFSDPILIPHDPARAERTFLAARQVMAWLGMPAGSRWIHFWTATPIAEDGSHPLQIEWLDRLPHHMLGTRYPAGPSDWSKWADHRIEAFGRLVNTSEGPGIGTVWPFELPGPPFILNAQLWQWRVHSPSTLLYAELQWRPGYADAMPYIGGWPKVKPRPNEIEEAWHALDLLWAMQKNPRPGPAKQTVTDARRQLLSAAVPIVKERGLKRLGLRTLATALAIEERTVSDIFTAALWKMRDLKSHPEILAAHRNYFS